MNRLRGRPATSRPVPASWAAATNPAPAGETQFFQVASGASNPLPMHEMFRNIHTYFTKNPMPQPALPRPLSAHS